MCCWMPGVSAWGVVWRFLSTSKTHSFVTPGIYLCVCTIICMFLERLSVKTSLRCLLDEVSAVSEDKATLFVFVCCCCCNLKATQPFETGVGKKRLSRSMSLVLLTNSPSWSLHTFPNDSLVNWKVVFPKKGLRLKTAWICCKNQKKKRKALM